MAGTGTTGHTGADPHRARWGRIARNLVAGTMAYNLLEAGVALVSGMLAASIALVGFGFDSVIECAAAGAMLWRLAVEARGADREAVQRSEHTVRRFIGATFIALALYVAGEAVATLWQARHPEESRVGIALAIASLVIMPLVAWGKLRAAAAISSRSLRAEARETLACAWLSAALLLGLGANAVLGWWWADPVAALLMVPWLVKEGLEGLRGDDCCECECEGD